VRLSIGRRQRRAAAAVQMMLRYDGDILFKPLPIGEEIIKEEEEEKKRRQEGHKKITEPMERWATRRSLGQRLPLAVQPISD